MKFFIVLLLASAAVFAADTDETMSMTAATQQWVTSATAAMINGTTNTIETGAGAANDMIAAASEGVKMGVNISSTLATAGNNVAKYGGGAAIDAGQAAMTGMGNVANKTFSATGKMMSLTPLVGGYLEAGANTMGNAVSSTANAVSNTVESAQNASAAVMNEINNQITNAQTLVNSAADKASSVVTSGVTAASNVASAAAGTSIKAARTATNKVVGLFG